MNSTLVPLLPAFIDRSPSASRTAVKRTLARVLRATANRPRARHRAQLAADIIETRLRALGPRPSADEVDALAHALEDEVFVELVDDVWLERCCARGRVAKRATVRAALDADDVAALLNLADHDPAIRARAQRSGATGPRRAARALLGAMVGAPSSWIRDLLERDRRAPDAR